MPPGSVPWKNFQKGACSGSRGPVNFWALSANSSKKVKDTNFKFGTHAPMGSPEMNPQWPENFFGKGDIAMSRDTISFGRRVKW